MSPTAGIPLDRSVEITEEMLDDARALEGTELRIEAWNSEATLDTIRHFVWGVGDPNPLYANEQYAAASVYGRIMAPPTFLYSVFRVGGSRAFPGTQGLYAGTRWKFHRAFGRGDRIVPSARIGGVKLMSGRTASRFACQEVLADFRLYGSGEVIAEAVGETFYLPRSGISGGLSYEPRDPYQYSPEEIDAIRGHAISEPIRGASPRYWEDVQVGESVPAVVKGPITQMTMTSYYAGCIPSAAYKACEFAWLYRDWADTNPDRLPTNNPLTYFRHFAAASMGHQDPAIAREMGLPGPYNTGTQKVAWMAHPLTNWMGDTGSITALDVQLRRPDIYGDTVWCSATVAGTGPDATVSLDLRATNQLGDVTANGTAVVRLPSRSHATAPSRYAPQSDSAAS